MIFVVQGTCCGADTEMDCYAAWLTRAQIEQERLLCRYDANTNSVRY